MLLLGVSHRFSFLLFFFFFRFGLGWVMGGWVGLLLWCSISYSFRMGWISALFLNVSIYSLFLALVLKEMGW